MNNTNSVKSKINELCNNGYSIDFGDVFESALENYKKIVWYAGFMILVLVIIFTALTVSGMISYVGLENMQELADKMKQFSSVEKMPLDIAIKISAVLLVFSAIISPFMAGFFKVADCADKGESFNVSTMFLYYKFPYIVNIIFSTILIGVISNAIALLFENIGLGFVGTSINLVISFATFLTIPLILFANLNAIESIQYSAILVTKQPITILGLIILGIIGVMLGFFGFCIGIVFTLPFMYSMNYIIYKKIIGIDDSSEIGQIGASEQ